MIGEFLLAEADDLVVQVRYEPMACGCFASRATAVAVGVGDHRVHVDAEDRWVVHVDGEAVDIADVLRHEVGDLVVAMRPGGVDITTADGPRIQVDIKQRGFLNVVVHPAGVPTWRGPLGDRNGDPADDFELPDGRDLGSPSAEVIAGEWADAWRLDASDSLFEYEPGEDTETFAAAPYPRPPRNASSPEAERTRAERRVQAEAVCRLAGITRADLLEACVFDFVTTGTAAVVMGVKHAHAIIDRFAAPWGAGGARSWSTVLPDLELREIEGRDLAVGDGLVLVRAGDQDVIRLHAIDAATGEVRWTTEGIERSCRPVVVDGAGVVAQLAADSAQLGEDPAALVLLSLDDGSELARYVPGDGDRLARCTDAMQSDGGTVVHASGRTVRAFDVGTGIEATWSVEVASNGVVAGPVVDGNVVVASPGDGVVTLEALSLADGERRAELAVEGAGIRSVRAIGDGLLTVATARPGSGSVPGTLAVVDAAGGELRLVWAQGFGPDDPRPPLHAARLDDLVVGWSDQEGRGLAAWSLADGALRWTHRASSFDNSDGLVAATDRVALISPFGGAWLEVVDATGAVVELRDGDESRTGIQQLTVLEDGTVLASGGFEDGGFYVEVVELPA